MSLPTISSPCVLLCNIENQACTGCGRSLKDISLWSRYSEEKRKTIMLEIRGKK